jgi:hypothetical protein
MSDFRVVDEFEFPSESGFSGSAGQKPVKGYMRGGQVKKPAEPSVQDELHTAGQAMGFKKGGMVKKDTSAEFVQKKGPQKTMDSGVQPKRRGRNQASVEAGGTKRVKMKYKKGGGVGFQHKPVIGK